MNLSNADTSAVRLAIFRRLIGVATVVHDYRRIWGRKLSKTGIEKAIEFNEGLMNPEENISAIRKLNFATECLNRLLFFNIVKFIAVSGSVAAGNARPEDDIDLFIVVKNHTAWIYRFFIRLKASGLLRTMSDSDVKDRLCLNFIAEERGVSFANHDLFTFHELFFLKPIYNAKFFNEILVENAWVGEYGVAGWERSWNRPTVEPISILLFPLNLAFFLAQLSYMLLRRHDPNLRRLFLNFKVGRIAFYTEGFRERKIDAFEKEYSRLMKTL